MKKIFLCRTLLNIINTKDQEQRKELENFVVLDLDDEIQKHFEECNFCKSEVDRLKKNFLPLLLNNIKSLFL